ncbi:TPA: hypothetical protein SMQ38_002639 [Proteus mirabilis]|nr:hypothetical protein [Proteus mirabilis]HEK0315289.1 hypothetical protein [Proteus mirabilis]HEK1083144.1 hypothetical protein [Proteus mirabilis]HEK1849676.1 hypothetical protein [Proteus mirabilis]HEK2594808.1 hypothetical protein [Proteus mirabilis]
MKYFLIKDNGEFLITSNLNKQVKPKGHKAYEPVPNSVIDKYKTTSFKIEGYYYNVAYETKEPTEEEFINKSSGLLDGKGGYIKK